MDKRDKNNCCDMRGFLSFLILFILSKDNLSGQEIAKELEKRRGDKPSPGTIYPALKSLKDCGWISEKKSGKSIIYTLTTKGKSVLKEAKAQFCRTFTDIF
ncbi:MAG: PadR family transcriptional regulator [Nanoarchaeota archaeon]